MQLSGHCTERSCFDDDCCCCWSDEKVEDVGSGCDPVTGKSQVGPFVQRMIHAVALQKSTKGNMFIEKLLISQMLTKHI